MLHCKKNYFAGREDCLAFEPCKAVKDAVGLVQDAVLKQDHIASDLTDSTLKPPQPLVVPQRNLRDRLSALIQAPYQRQRGDLLRIAGLGFGHAPQITSMTALPKVILLRARAALRSAANARKFVQSE